MEAHSSKSNQKRQCEQENRPSALRKSQRLLDKLQAPSTSSEQQSEPDQSMKITGMNDDCLQKIFEHLDQRSLFNVAVANEWLRPAANVVYERKFGNKSVSISNRRDDAAFQSYPHHIIINGLKICLQLLRCLGSSIVSLAISYSGWNQKQCKYIYQYINKYCAESLVAIKFQNKSKWDSIGPFEKPFVNVRTVAVHSCDLRNQLSSFVEWFPNRRSMKLIRVRTSRRIDLSKFDHLNDLSIYVPNDGDKFTTSEATRLIQQLPHLQSLDVWGSEFTLKQLLNIIKNHRTIRNLKVKIYDCEVTATALDAQQLIDEHPALIDLEMMGLGLALDTIIPLISELNALMHFRFEIVNRLEYDRLVGQLDGQWRSTFSDREPPNYHPCFVQLER